MALPPPPPPPRRVPLFCQRSQSTADQTAEVIPPVPHGLEGGARLEEPPLDAGEAGGTRGGEGDGVGAGWGGGAARGERTRSSKSKYEIIILRV